MPDIIKVNYNQTGKSTTINAMGMREMQAKAYDCRNAKYLLLKAPPASGKSRALMYLASDKLQNQGIKKVIVAVPEKAIGSSFANTNLTTPSANVGNVVIVVWVRPMIRPQDSLRSQISSFCSLSQAAFGS